MQCVNRDTESNSYYGQQLHRPSNLRSINRVRATLNVVKNRLGQDMSRNSAAYTTIGVMPLGRRNFRKW